MRRNATHIGLALVLVLGVALSSVPGASAQMMQRAEVGLRPIVPDTVTKDIEGALVDESEVSDRSTAPILLKSTHEPELSLPDHHNDPLTPEGFCCAEPNLGMTMLFVMAIEVIPNYFNWRVADDSTAILSLDSWKHNMVKGMEWDHNNFTTNMFAHPYHGNVYFNSARAHGYNYWSSSFFAGLGSFMWEMYGEANRGAINDWIMTTMGGITMGEALHRSARMLRNNEQSGVGRTMREFGAFLIDPVGGTSRAMRGETSKIGKNPVDRFPTSGGIQITAGYRRVGGDRNDGNPSPDTVATPYVDMVMIYGDFMYDHDRPFDSFRISVQANFSDKVPIGRMAITGTLWGRTLKDEENVKHAFTFDQQFLYLENKAAETGGQFFGASLHSRFKLGSNWGINTHVQPLFALLTGINSEYEEFTGRPYDFGTGFGLQLDAVIAYKGYPVFRAMLLELYSATINGAKGNHNLLIPVLQARWKIAKSVGIGADVWSIRRNSHYDNFPDTSTIVPTFRLNVNFTWLTNLRGR